MRTRIRNTYLHAQTNGLGDVIGVVSLFVLLFAGLTFSGAT